jgi:uncharacterized BrkB/YihY/UPF0761 family membrane protein
MPEDTTKWGPGATLIKALALILPWGVIEVAAGRHENFGYTFGLFVGILCMHIVPPREKTLWRWLLIGAVMSVVHPVLHAFLPKSWVGGP